jgi:hypothetical protein
MFLAAMLPEETRQGRVLLITRSIVRLAPNILSHLTGLIPSSTSQQAHDHARRGRNLDPPGGQAVRRCPATTNALPCFFYLKS